MKIGIIGDTHFGAGYALGKTDSKTQFNFRLLDFISTFNSIIDGFVKNNVHLVVLTGDIFETRHPTSAQLNAFSKCAQRAINKNIEIVIVVGNHDQQRTIATTTVDIFKSLETPGISIYESFGIHSVKDENDDDVNLILMPYRDRRMIGAKTTSGAVDLIGAQLNKIISTLESPKIVVGHFMIGQSITGENPDSFSINELILPLSIFSDCDTVVMGHIHKHMVLSDKKPIIIYTGSMEKNSFGEKHHSKVSLIIDTNNIEKIKVLQTKTRSLHEMNFNYTDGEKCFKHQITDRIILDIEKFNMKWNLTNTIVKFVAKVKKDDLFHINQERVKEYILSKGVKHLLPLQVSSINTRKLRNKKITENVKGKKAMTTFINQLVESEQIKKRLIKAANLIIEEVEGK